MTIALYQTDIIGPRIYVPEGPYAQNTLYPFPSVKPGTVVEGDSEAEYTFLLFNATAGQTVNQGDAVLWDNSYQAIISGSIQTAAGCPVGMDIGTIFLGGSQVFIQGNNWSYTFAAAGLYGVWAQRAGTSLLRTGTITSQATAPLLLGNLGSQLGAVGFVAGPAGHSAALQGIYSCAQSAAFTANTTNGSVVLAAPSSFQFLVRGQTLSGAGIPNGAVIADFGSNTIIMSLAATATASGVTVTAANGSTWGTTVTGSKVVTGVTSIAGLYPNQVLATTGGIAAGSVIQSILGNAAGAYTINMSIAATTSAFQSLTLAAPTNAAPNYLEAFLRWPFISGAMS